MEFVEVRGKTTEIAIEAALGELGLTSVEEAEVEIIDPGKKGFLGVGGSDAVVRVRPKPKAKPKRRRRRRGGSKPEGAEGAETAGRSGGQRQPQARRQSGGGAGGPRTGAPQAKQQERRVDTKAEAPPVEESAVDTAAVQAEAVEGFLKGLVGAFGIEASVDVTTSSDGVSAAVSGDQAEALVGEKGAVMQAVQEVTRTVVQRRFHDPARVRVDVGGYNERRRQALGIYAQRLAEQVKSEGGEIMLEPMNAADRKVVHDTISGIEGVRSYSEGEDPRRCVVIGAEE